MDLRATTTTALAMGSATPPGRAMDHDGLAAETENEYYVYLSTSKSLVETPG